MVSVINRIGTRNGLFYAPAYIAMGLLFAEKARLETKRGCLLAVLILSLILLVAESAVFVIMLNTTSTILWLSVYPASYALFQLTVTARLRLPKDVSILLRRMSILLYVTHGLFLEIFGFLGYGIPYFLATLFCSAILGIVILRLSNRWKVLRWLY